MRRVQKKEIEKLDFKVDYFKNRTILLLGASNSGKSRIIIDIMHLLKEEVPICYIFSPTNKVNGTFSGIIPESLIADDVNLECIENIFANQEERIKIYKLCNDKNILIDIAYKLEPSITSMIELINNKYIQNRVYLQKNKDVGKIEKLDDAYNSQIVQVLKNHIKKHHISANFNKLNEQENNIARLLDINVNVLLVFDDVGSNSKTWGKSEVIKKIFFESRHYNITTMIAMQSDKELIPAIRKNAFIVFFTNPQCLQGFYESTSNNFTKEQKKEASLICKEIFKKVDNKDTYKKACYIRLDDKLTHYKARLHDKFVYNSELFEKFPSETSSDVLSSLTNDFIQKL